MLRSSRARGNIHIIHVDGEISGCCDTLGYSVYDKIVTLSYPLWNMLKYMFSAGSTYKIECDADHANLKYVLMKME
jgi:hypothetical protein